MKSLWRPKVSARNFGECFGDWLEASLDGRDAAWIGIRRISLPDLREELVDYLDNHEFFPILEDELVVAHQLAGIDLSKLDHVERGQVEHTARAELVLDLVLLAEEIRRSDTVTRKWSRDQILRSESLAPNTYQAVAYRFPKLRQRAEFMRNAYNPSARDQTTDLPMFSRVKQLRLMDGGNPVPPPASPRPAPRPPVKPAEQGNASAAPSRSINDTTVRQRRRMPDRPAPATADSKTTNASIEVAGSGRLTIVRIEDPNPRAFDFAFPRIAHVTDGDGNVLQTVHWQGMDGRLDVRVRTGGNVVVVSESASNIGIVSGPNTRIAVLGVLGTVDRRGASGVHMYMGAKWPFARITGDIGNDEQLILHGELDSFELRVRGGEVLDATHDPMGEGSGLHPSPFADSPHISRQEPRPWNDLPDSFREMGSNKGVDLSPML